MKHSASSVSDGFSNVWTALGGTHIKLPSTASMLPSGVTKRTVPAGLLTSAGLASWTAHTFGNQEALVMEAVPVHRRPRRLRRKDQGDGPNAVVCVGAVLVDVAGHGPEHEDLGRLPLGQPRWDWAPVGWHGGFRSDATMQGTACSISRRQKLGFSWKVFWQTLGIYDADVRTPLLLPRSRTVVAFARRT